MEAIIALVEVRDENELLVMADYENDSSQLLVFALDGLNNRLKEYNKKHTNIKLVDYQKFVGKVFYA
jgi:hypothetical protein